MKPMPQHSKIVVSGAREHNRKDISVELPRDSLVVITGLSGSGKSSLAFDTIYAEGQRRYVESLSAYARQFLELMQKPEVESIEGLSPAISIEQKTTSRNPRSTVGTVTEIYDYMRLLWARVGVPYSPATGLPIVSQTVSQMVDRVLAMPQGTRTTKTAYPGEKTILPKKSPSPFSGSPPPELDPPLFSSNTPFGACPAGDGPATNLFSPPVRVVHNPRRSLAEGAVSPWSHS